MKSQDVITAAGYGYTRVWDDRHYLIRLGGVPFFIVAIMHILTLTWAGDAPLMRQGLLLLPAFFAMGWFLAQYARSLLLNEYWPYRPAPQATGQIDIPHLITRTRGIISGTLMFVVMSMGKFMIFGGFLATAQESYTTGNMPAEPDPKMMLPALILMAATIYAVRFIWLYIPAAVLVSPGAFLKRIGGFMASLHILTLMMVCMIPPTILTYVAASILLRGQSLLEAPTIILTLVVLISQAVDMLVWAIATAGMACLMKDHLPHTPNAFDMRPTHPK
ncbi:MAG: hypothetical protein V4621_01230 [Pseudomonadota bacterium]